MTSPRVLPATILGRGLVALCALAAYACWLAPNAGAFQDEVPTRAIQQPAPDDVTPGAGGNAAAKKQQRAQRKPRPSEDGPAGERPQRGMRDPAQMVNMMMQKFDSDGDEKLDSVELTAMLTFMRERSGQMGLMAGREGAPNGAFQPGGEQVDGPRKRPGANMGAKRPGGRGGDSQQDEAGGVKPKRPPAE